MSIEKILHISDQSLPDWRIEKAALSAKKKKRRGSSSKVYFAGLTPKKVNTTFDKIYHLDWDYKARYYYPNEWQALKKQLLKIILDCDPDIIHAHDIFAAYLVKETIGHDIPWIYDNHEYWSRYIIYQYLQNDYFKQSDPQHISIPNLWRTWEINMINESIIPMIVTSKITAEELNYFDSHSNVFIVPNYPSEIEIKDIPKPVEHKHISSVFANGGQPHPGNKTPFKNIDGFLDLFGQDSNGLGHLHTIGWHEPDRDWIHNHGPLDRSKMYEVLSNCDIGLIPWKHHPFHPYCSPNRAYEYAHAGLVVMVTDSLESVINDFTAGNAISFRDYYEMIELIKYYRDNPSRLYDIRLMTYNHARKELLWENYENNIFDAYNKAL